MCRSSEAYYYYTSRYEIKYYQIAVEAIWNDIRLNVHGKWTKNIKKKKMFFKEINNNTQIRSQSLIITLHMYSYY